MIPMSFTFVLARLPYPVMTPPPAWSAGVAPGLRVMDDRPPPADIGFLGGIDASGVHVLY
jgi:hypothetical protein